MILLKSPLVGKGDAEVRFAGAAGFLENEPADPVLGEDDIVGIRVAGAGVLHAVAFVSAVLDRLYDDVGGERIGRSARLVRQQGHRRMIENNGDVMAARKGRTIDFLARALVGRRIAKGFRRADAWIERGLQALPVAVVVFLMEINRQIAAEMTNRKQTEPRGEVGGQTDTGSRLDGFQI